MHEFENHAAKLNRSDNKDHRINITGVEYSNGNDDMTIIATSKLFAHDAVLDKLYDQGYNIYLAIKLNHPIHKRCEVHEQQALHTLLPQSH